MSEQDIFFSANLLSGFINDLIKLLVHHGLTDFKVMDSCCTTTCAPTSNIPGHLNELRKVAAKDGLHFGITGYTNLAERTISCVRNIWLP